MDIKDLIHRLLKPSEQEMPLFVALASFLLIAIANGFQHIGGLAPCPLCMEQRQAYWAAIIAAGLTTFLWRHAATRETVAPRLGALLITVALAYGFYLAAFHTGIEQGWWKGPESCTAGGGAQSLDDLLSNETGVVMCDEIPWSLFGISMAGYNALAALVLTVYSALPQARRLLSR